MNVDKLLLLQEELRGLENAATHLRFSINRTQGLLNQQDWQPEELERLTKYVESGGPTKARKAALADVFWALLNSSEFLFNH